MSIEKEPPVVPRRALRDFPLLRQRAFAEERLAPLLPPEEDSDKQEEKPEADPGLHENLLRQYREKA